MKKIILHETQVKRLMDNVLNEQVPAIPTPTDDYELHDGRYQVECEFHFSAGEFTTYKNGEIYDIAHGKGIISYGIDIEFQPYGIRNIKIVDVKYPPVIETTLEYLPEGHNSEEDSWFESRIEEPIKIPIDWRKTEIYKWHNNDDRINYIGIGEIVYADIKPDGKGGLIGYVDQIDAREFRGVDDD